MMMDLLDDILAHLPKPAANTPPAAPPITPPATPPATSPAAAPALGEDGKPLPQKPAGKTIHTYGDQFKKTFGERKT
jgi:hypothetical protein